MFPIFYVFNKASVLYHTCCQTNHLSNKKFERKFIWFSNKFGSRTVKELLSNQLDGWRKVANAVKFISQTAHIVWGKLIWVLTIFMHTRIQRGWPIYWPLFVFVFSTVFFFFPFIFFFLRARSTICMRYSSTSANE